MKAFFKLKPIVLLAVLHPVYAADNVTELDTVVVRPSLNNEDLIGRTQGYFADSSNVWGKNKRALNQTAQSVSVVTRRQLEDQHPATLSQALNYSAGAFGGLVGAASRYDYIGLRGFNDNSTDNVLIDGQRLLSDSNTYSSMQIDPYFIERVDLLKGPASSSYGRAAPGGLVGATTKRPLHDAYHEINLFAGSDNQRGGSIDLTDNLDSDGHVSYRLTGLAKHSDSQNDFHKTARYAIAPSLDWNISPSTNLLLQAYIQNDPKGGYHSGLPAEGMLYPKNGFVFPRHFSDSEPTDRFKRRQNIYSYQFNHMFAPDWQLTSKFRYADVHTENRQVWQTGWANDTTLTRAAGNSGEHLQSFAFDNALKGKVQTGALSHDIVVGSDYQRRKTNVDWAYNYSDVPGLNVLRPQYNQKDYPFNQYPQNNLLKLSQLGFYARDHITLGRWHFDLGARHDSVKTSSTSLTQGTTSSQWDGGKTTWNASALYAWDNGLSGYAAYSTGFNPNTYTDAAGKLLQPTESKQIEVGLKYQPKNTRHLFTLAAYDLTQKNVANRVINGNYYIPSGQVKSKGLEAEAKLSLTDKWFVQMALAANHAEFKHNTDGLDGKTPHQTPRYTASLWSNYDFANGLSLNAGVRHISGIWADHANTRKVPAYTLVDAGVRYHFKHLNPALRGLYGSISANNLFDKRYVASCNGLGYCYYGEGRNVLANVSYRW